MAVGDSLMIAAGAVGANSARFFVSSEATAEQKHQGLIQTRDVSLLTDALRYC